MSGEKIVSLIEELKRFDNEEGYRLKYGRVKEEMEETVESLVGEGDEALEYLHPLLERPETWSCLFALEAIKGIGSEKSVSYLIDFIRENEEGPQWDNCEEAMFALAAVGKPAVGPLLEAVKEDFRNEVFYTYLVGALTRIKDERVYSFMREVTVDYMENREKYAGWFDIDVFTYDFDKQERKEIVPLLKELVSMEELSERERREIEDTIKMVEDPEGFKEEMEREAEALKKALDKLKVKKVGKVGRNDPCPCGSGKKYKKCCLMEEKKMAQEHKTGEKIYSAPN